MRKLSTKKVFALTAAAMMAFSGLAGCGTQAVTGLEDFKNRPKKVSVVYVANAYGKEWITQVAKEYMTNYNKDTYISLKLSVTPDEDFSKIATGSASADLYFLDAALKDLKGTVEDVTDVWNGYATGEEGTDGAKLIKDKLTPLLKSMKDPHGTRSYSLPYSQGTTYGFVYNKTVLDAAFPNGYILPRTTDELFEMGDLLKDVDLSGIKEDQDVYLMSCSFADQNENLKYSQQTWFYQMLGQEAAEQYYEGRYWDEEQQKYVFDEAKPTVYEAYKDELKGLYNILDKLTTKDNGYVHMDAGSMDYIYASGAVAGAGFKMNKSKAAFKVDGPYFESETKMFLESLKNRGQEQEMGMMHFPVASAIINRLETVNDDATLREVISYVDGEKTTKPEGVSDGDIAIVAEARGMTPMYLGGGMVIPKTAANKAGAKDFMRFVCSDAAAIASAKALKGLEILPYGKVVTEEELGFERSYFLKTVSKWQTENMLLAGRDGEFATWGDFYEGKDANFLSYTIYGGSRVGADSWWQTCYSVYEYDWKSRVDNYTGHGGVTD